MTTALAELDSQVLDKIEDSSDGEGYRALDLMRELNTHSESEVQKVIAKLLVDGRIEVTTKRKLRRT